MKTAILTLQILAFGVVALLGLGAVVAPPEPASVAACVAAGSTDLRCQLETIPAGK